MLNRPPNVPIRDRTRIPSLQRPSPLCRLDLSPSLPSLQHVVAITFKAKKRVTNPVYCRTAELMEADIGDELVALDAKAGKCFGFNEVATSVWRSLEEPKSFNELRDELLDEYDVVEDQCTRELEELLEDLISKQLIEKSQSEGNKLR